MLNSRRRDIDGKSGDAGGATPQQTPFSVPVISLPKSGGAIRGIGEKFAANSVTGTGSLSVSVYTSLGQSGLGPQLSFSYDSGAGNGPFGFGWNLSVPSITWKTDKRLPRYQEAAESDGFPCLGFKISCQLLNGIAIGSVLEIIAVACV